MSSRGRQHGDAEWVASLRVGDSVGVWEVPGPRYVYTGTVTARTKKRVTVDIHWVFGEDAWGYAKAGTLASRRFIQATGDQT